MWIFCCWLPFWHWVRYQEVWCKVMFDSTAFMRSHRSSNIRSQIDNCRLIGKRIEIESYPNVLFPGTLILYRIIIRVGTYARPGAPALQKPSFLGSALRSSRQSTDRSSSTTKSKMNKVRQIRELNKKELENGVCVGSTSAIHLS